LGGRGDGPDSASGCMFQKIIDNSLNSIFDKNTGISTQNLRKKQKRKIEE
jgi:hypothetical protein